MEFMQCCPSQQSSERGSAPAAASDSLALAAPQLGDRTTHHPLRDHQLPGLQTDSSSVFYFKCKKKNDAKTLSGGILSGVILLPNHSGGK